MKLSKREVTDIAIPASEVQEGSLAPPVDGLPQGQSLSSQDKKATRAGDLADSGLDWLYPSASARFSHVV